MRRGIMAAATAWMAGLAAAGTVRADYVAGGVVTEFNLTNGVSLVDSVVGPETEAPNSSAAPLLWPGAAIEWQQVYGPDSVGMRPLDIAGIAFRPDGAQLAPLDATLADFTVLASVNQALIPTAPDPSNPSANLGADTAVVATGQVHLTSPGATDLGPGIAQPFSVVIPFDHPFTWNPTLGVLVLDFRVTAPAGTPFFLDADDQDPGIGRVVAIRAVPEPAAWGLLLLGLPALAWARRRA